jgi:RNA polymerase sigma factor (sigma-70 family)
VQERIPNSRRTTLPDLEDLLRRVREGCPDSIQELFDRWIPDLLRVVRHQLDQTPQLRKLFDSDDFLQETRLVVHANEPPSRVLQSAATFFSFLKVVAANKVHEAQRKHLQTLRSSINREVAWGSPGVCVDIDLASHQPAVHEHLLAEDEFQQLLQGRPWHHQQVLRLLREGYNYREVAEEMGLHERTVHRFLARVRSTLQGKDATGLLCLGADSRG